MLEQSLGFLSREQVAHTLRAGFEGVIIVYGFYRLANSALPLLSQRSTLHVVVERQHSGRTGEFPHEIFGLGIVDTFHLVLIVKILHLSLTAYQLETVL